MRLWPFAKAARLGFSALLGAALLAVSGSASAAGLGNIEVYSTLYQPLDAEIEILNIQPGEVDRLRVDLATEGEFRRAGIDPQTVFNSFRFDVINKNGRYYVHITSGATVIREPFLHFLISADWVYGKLVREYTVILDLPLFGEDSQQSRSSDLVVPEKDHSLDDFSGAGVPVRLDPEPAPPAEEPSHSDALAAQELAEIPEEIIEDDIPELAPDPEPPAPEPVYEEEPSDEYAGDQYGPVQAGENLWNIIATRKPSSVTMNQAMLSVLRANTDAFISDNINLLKTGVVLRIPGYQEMLDLSRDAALEEAKRQNALWEEYRASVSGISYQVEDSGYSSAYDDGGLSDNPLLSGGDTGAEAPAPDSLESLLGGSSSSPGPGAESQTTLDILPGAQDSILGEGADADNITQTASEPKTDGADAISSELRENIETEAVASESVAERLGALQEQQEAAERIIDIQDDQASKLQSQASDILEEPAAPAADAAPAGAEEGAAEEEAVDLDAMSPLEKLLYEQRKEYEAQQKAKQADEAKKQAGAPKGLPETEDKETPLDFLKVVLPRSMVNNTWDALADVGGNPAQITEYPIMLGIIIFIVVLIVGLLWRRHSQKELEAEMAAARQFGEEYDEFGNLVGGEDHIDEGEEITNLRDEDDPGRAAIASAETVIRTDDAPAAADSAPEPVYAPDEPAAAAPEPAAEPALAAPEPAKAKAADSSLGDSNDPTVTEASTYISYALYDQAEELLRDAVAKNPGGANAFLSALMDVYYTSGNKEELIKLAGTIKSDYGDGDLWEKVIVLGRAIAADEPIFKDAQIQGKFTTDDFNIAAPVEADLSLDSADSGETDFAFTADDASQLGSDMQLGDDDDFLSQFEEDFDKTMADLGMGGDDESGSDTGDSKKKRIIKSPTMEVPDDADPLRGAKGGRHDPGQGGSFDAIISSSEQAAKPDEAAELDEGALDDLLDSEAGGDDADLSAALEAAGAAGSAGEDEKPDEDTVRDDLPELESEPEPEPDSGGGAVPEVEEDTVRDQPPEVEEDTVRDEPPALSAESEPAAGAAEATAGEADDPLEDSGSLDDIDLDELSESDMVEVMDSPKAPIEGKEASVEKLMQEVTSDPVKIPGGDELGLSADSELEKTSDIALNLSDILGDATSDGSEADEDGPGDQVGAGKPDEDDIQMTTEHEVVAPDPKEEPGDEPAPLLNEETSSFMADILKAGDDDDEDFTSSRTFDDEEDPFTKTITGSELMGEVDDDVSSDDFRLQMTATQGNDSITRGIEEQKSKGGGDEDWALQTSSGTSTKIVNEEEELLDAAVATDGELDVDLGLAEQYINLGDGESARTALLRVIETGGENSKKKARALLAKLEGKG